VTQGANDVLREWSENARYWQLHSDTIRTMFVPLTQALIEEAEISEGDRVLDIAAGPGEPTLTIAELVGPTGSVNCTDAVAEMVAAAEGAAKRRGLTNITFQQCLADALPFESNSFDVAVSRLGAMFFPDPLSACREILRVIKREGTMSFAVWYESKANPFTSIVTNVMSRHVETPPADPDAPGAFRFAERGKLERILKSAGATTVHERMLEFLMEAPISREGFWELRAGTSGTLREKLATLTEEKRQLIRSEVIEAVAEFFPKGTMSFPAKMLIVSGKKPA
jgi:ubiquinone/menaquinone biosynthesis C-methylase UbiE